MVFNVDKYIDRVSEMYCTEGGVILWRNDLEKSQEAAVGAGKLHVITWQRLGRSSHAAFTER